MWSYVIAAFLLGIGVGYWIVDFRYATLRKEVDAYLAEASRIVEGWDKKDGGR